MSVKTLNPETDSQQQEHSSSGAGGEGSESESVELFNDVESIDEEDLEFEEPDIGDDEQRMMDVTSLHVAKEIGAVRKTDKPYVRGIVLGYINFTNKGNVSMEPVAGMFDKVNALVAIIDFPDFNDNPGHFERYDANTIHISAEIGATKVVRDLMGSLGQDVPSGREMLALSLEEIIPVSMNQGTANQFAGPGTIIDMNGLDVKLLYGFKKSPKGSTKTSDGRDSTADKPVKRDASDLEHLCKRKMYSVFDVIIYKQAGPSVTNRIRRYMDPFSQVRLCTDHYSALLYTGQVKGYYQRGKKQAYMVQLNPHVSNGGSTGSDRDFALSMALPPKTVRTEGREFPAKDQLFYKQSLVVKCWPRNLSMREAQKKGVVSTRGIDLTFWESQCRPMFGITRQSVWKSLMKSVWPALEMMVIGGFDIARSKNLGYNLSDRVGMFDEGLKFTAKAVFFNRPKFLRTHGFNVSGEWVESYFSGRDEIKAGSARNLNTVDPDREEVKKPWSGGCTDWVNLSNCSESLLDFMEGPYEFRVLTDRWWPTAEELSCETPSGIRAQKMMLQEIGKLSVEEATKCISSAPGAKFSADTQTKVIFAVRVEDRRGRAK